MAPSSRPCYSLYIKPSINPTDDKHASDSLAASTKSSSSPIPIFELLLRTLLRLLLSLQVGTLIKTLKKLPSLLQNHFFKVKNMPNCKSYFQKTPAPRNNFLKLVSPKFTQVICIWSATSFVSSVRISLTLKEQKSQTKFFSQFQS